MASGRLFQTTGPATESAFNIGPVLDLAPQA